MEGRARGFKTPGLDSGASLLIYSGLAGRGAASAEDAPGTPTQSHTSPSILVYEDETGGMKS